MAKDPIRFEGGTANLYEYADSAPESRGDPNGLETIIIVNHKLSLAGAIAGSHAAVAIRRKGIVIMYDGGGSFSPKSGLFGYRRHVQFGDVEVFQGDFGFERAYMSWLWNKDGLFGKVQELSDWHYFDTTYQEDLEILDRMERLQSSCESGICAVCAASILEGVGPFPKDLSFFNLTPQGLRDRVSFVGKLWGLLFPGRYRHAQFSTLR
jgi:hypothetical protein